MGTIVLSVGVEVKTGTEEVFIYGNNFTDYHWDGYDGSSVAPPRTNREAFLFHVNETNIYEPYDFGGFGGTTFGLLILILGMFLFVYFIATAGD